MTDTIQVHGSVILTGSAEGIAGAHQQLAADFHCHRYRDNALLVADVADHELPVIERSAHNHGIRIEKIRDAHTIRLAEDDKDPNAVKQPKQPNLELIEGGWYRTKQDYCPLIHVIKVRNEVLPDGIQTWLFEVDMVAADAMPQPATLSAEQLKSYSPKPAALKDFEDLDIVPPDGFEPTPHSIPSVEDDVEDLQEKFAGVSLPQAQLAAMLLQKQLGMRNATTEIVQLPGKGFYVRAHLLRRIAGVPAEIAGTPIRYR
jgi:hypothetical protein